MVTLVSALTADVATVNVALVLPAGIVMVEGTVATEINYPCGTHELAEAVADLVRAAPDPARAVVGQKNHGLTITGPSLDEIFARVDGKIVRKVPMD